MIYDIFHVLLWVTAILLVVSGLDDIFIDLVYWFNRGRYKRQLPTVDEIQGKPERSIAIMVGAWQEYRVIGRTLSYALNNLKYSNFKIFVAVYPNDLRTVKAVREYARKDKRVILCLNPQDGPTTKADNLNNLYSCVLEYERLHGNFDIMLVHDSEDFIHPMSLKLFNYMIMYKGYMAIQIPVIPIKSSAGKFFHRMYCDAFSELHTKDMIVRQTIGSFIPFAGTGMGFSRKAFFYLEEHSEETPAEVSKFEEENIYATPKHSFDNILNKADSLPDNTEEEEEEVMHFTPEYSVRSENLKPRSLEKTKSGFTPRFRQYVIVGFLILAGIASYFMYKNNTSNMSAANLENTLKNMTSTNLIAAENNSGITGENPSVPDGINEISIGYKDENLNKIYLKLENGKYALMESSWSTEKKARNRKNSLIDNYRLSEPVNIIQAESNGDIIYRVIIGEFESLEKTRENVKGLKF